MLSVKANKLIQDRLANTTGKVVLFKDFSNVSMVGLSTTEVMANRDMSKECAFP